MSEEAKKFVKQLRKEQDEIFSFYVQMQYKRLRKLLMNIQYGKMEKWNDKKEKITESEKL